jgi:hypothetical protein
MTRQMEEAAKMLSAFLGALQAEGLFNSLAEKLVVEATPEVVAYVLSEGN